MSRVVYLNAMQALDAALRHGSMKRAAAELGITPAAVGQRIRSLENFAGTPLLDRGLTGVTPTDTAKGLAAGLRRAFEELDQVALRLNLDRDGPVRIACDPDLLALWLRPRLSGFAALYPATRLAFLAEGDPVPAEMTLRFGGVGEVLMPDWLVPVTSPGNLHRVMQNPIAPPLEGMPLLHVGPAPDASPELGWPDWIARFPLRKDGANRGFRYRHFADAHNFAAASVGFALLPLSLTLFALQSGKLLRLFPDLPLLSARNAWTLQLTRPSRARPILQLVADWLRSEAATHLADFPGAVPGKDLAMEVVPAAR